MGNRYIEMVLEHHRKIGDRPAIEGPTEKNTIHHSVLPCIPKTHPLVCEWDTYRREVAQLLMKGFAGKWIVVKGQSILGVFNSMVEAEEKCAQLKWPFLIRQVLEQEPVLRIRGYDLPWPTSSFPLAKPA
jgi:hypothetical protein